MLQNTSTELPNSGTNPNPKQTYKTLNKVPKGKTFNKPYYANSTKSLIEYYLTTGMIPSQGSVIVSLLLKKKDDNTKENVLMSRVEKNRKENPQIKFESLTVVITEYTEKSLSLALPFPQLKLDEKKHVRQWRKEMMKSIIASGINKNIRSLIQLLVPDEIHSALENYIGTDSCLDAVCKYFEKDQYYEVPVQPKQADYVFIRDYIEAVEKYTKEISKSNTEMYNFNLPNFINTGLSTTCKIGCHYKPIIGRTEYLKEMEGMEKDLMEQIQEKLNKKNLLSGTSYFSGTRSPPHYCEGHRCRTVLYH